MVSPENLDQEFEDISPLLDKKEWLSVVDSEVAKAHDSGQNLAVLFLDLDFFKDVNDILGHQVGDDVLEQIKAIVARSLRSPESKGRDSVDSVSGPDTDSFEGQSGHIGGDEFALLAYTDEAGAQSIKTRLRERFFEFRDREENEELRKTGVGIAIGFATLEPNMSSSELLRRADSAMYKDKLDQMPELTDHQMRAILDAKYVLKQAGVRVRLRDFPKYARRYPELFED